MRHLRAFTFAVMAVLTVAVLATWHTERAYALSAATLTTENTVNSVSTTKFQRVYVNGTTNVVFLDASNSGITQSLYDLSSTNVTTATLSSIGGYANTNYNFYGGTSIVGSSTDSQTTLATVAGSGSTVDAVAISAASGGPYIVNVAGEKITSTSALAGKAINSITVALEASICGGCTSGETIGVGVYDGCATSAPVATIKEFSTMSIASVSTSALTDYTFSIPSTSPSYVLRTNGCDMIGVIIKGAYYGNAVWVGRAASDVYDSTNSLSQYFTGAPQNTWTTSVKDLRMVVKNTPNAANAADNVLGSNWRSTNNVAGTTSLYTDTGLTSNHISGFKLEHDSSSFIPTSVDVYISNSTGAWGSIRSTQTLSTTLNSFISYNFTSVTGRYIKMQVHTAGAAAKWEVVDWKVGVSSASTTNANYFNGPVESDSTHYIVAEDTGTVTTQFVKLNTADLSIISAKVVTPSTATIPVAIGVSANNIYEAARASTTLYLNIMSRALDNFTENVANVASIDTSTPIYVVPVESTTPDHDTVYVFYEKSSALNVLKYTTGSGGSVLGTTMTHSSTNDFSVTRLNSTILVQTSSKLYQLATATDTITLLASNTYPSRYPQTFTVADGGYSLITDVATVSNSTSSTAWTPLTGASTVGALPITAVNNNTGTLTTYTNAKYYLLNAQKLIIDASSSGATSWTIKSYATGNHQWTIQPYTERINVPLIANNSLLSTGLIQAECDAPYPISVKAYPVVGSETDCHNWLVVSETQATVGRQLPWTDSPQPVHVHTLTAFTIQLTNTNTPQAYRVTSYYPTTAPQKAVDQMSFSIGNQADQRLLYGNCYYVSVDQISNSQRVLAGQLCATGSTTQIINIGSSALINATAGSVVVPLTDLKNNWLIDGFRNDTNANNQTITFDVGRIAGPPFTACVGVPINSSYTVWNNFTSPRTQLATGTVTNVGNRTTLINVYDCSNYVGSKTMLYSTLSLKNVFAPLGSDFIGLPIGLIPFIFSLMVFNQKYPVMCVIFPMAVLGLLLYFHILPGDVWSAAATGISFFGGVTVFLLKRSPF